MLILVVLLASCQLNRKLTGETKTGGTSGQSAILFLVFKISKDSAAGKHVIELVSQIQHEGQIKAGPDLSNEFEDYLTVEVFEQNRRTNVITVEHPLRKHIEYVDDRGMLASKLVESDQAEFFVRVQVSGRSTKIRVFETLKGTARQELKTFNL